MNYEKVSKKEDCRWAACKCRQNTSLIWLNVSQTPKKKALIHSWKFSKCFLGADLILNGYSCSKLRPVFDHWLVPYKTFKWLLNRKHFSTILIIYIVDKLKWFFFGSFLMSNDKFLQAWDLNGGHVGLYIFFCNDGEC